MNKLLISLFSVGILSLLVIQNNIIFAQSNEEIINGFLQNIEDYFLCLKIHNLLNW